MIKLTYTEEMEKQDELWETENEDFEIMERLQKEIVKEAEMLGFKGVTETIVYKDREVVTEIFETYNDLLEERRTGDGYQVASSGNCKYLIECFEGILNKS